MPAAASSVQPKATLYAKIFRQIYESSIAENPETRFTFMDLLVLADQDGVVDMTHESIARITNRPISVIRKTISELESPDPQSRTPTEDGARLKRLDAHRDWGWMIINYERFRKTVSEDQRREKTRERVRKYRQKQPKSDDVTQCNAHVTPCDASNAMQKQKQKQKERESAPFPECETPSWDEFWTFCQMGHGPGAEFYARDKFQAAAQGNWEKQRNWRAYATRCKTWWENDGSPMHPKNDSNGSGEVVLTDKRWLEERNRKDAEECARLKKLMDKQPPLGTV